MSTVTKFLVFIGLTVLLLFGVQTCSTTTYKSESQPISWVAPGAQSTDTIIKTVIKERVVVRRVFVPRVTADADNKPKYLLRTDTLTIAAKCDSAGISIDSIDLPNTKAITYTTFNRAVQVSVTNSNPLFHTANVDGFVIPTKEVPRLGYGPFIGVGVTATGAPAIVVGVGVSYNLRKRN